MDTDTSLEADLYPGSSDLLVHRMYENCDAQDGTADSHMAFVRIRQDIPAHIQAFPLQHIHCRTLDIRDLDHSGCCRRNHAGFVLSLWEMWMHIPENTFQSPPKA